MLDHAITLAFALLFGLTSSPYSRDMPGYSSESFLLANQVQAAVFVHKLQAATKRGDRSALIEMVRLPLRVNGPQRQQIRYYRTRSDIRRDFERIFEPSVLEAISKQDLGDLSMSDGNYMIGLGDLWFGQTCLGKFCDLRGRQEIFAINRS